MFITDVAGLLDASGNVVAELDASDAEALARQRQWSPAACAEAAGRADAWRRRRRYDGATNVIGCGCAGRGRGATTEPATATRNPEERTMLLHDESPAAVEEREKAFILGTYARTPFHPRSGKGARIIDADGREYWDLLGGIAVNVLGHQASAARSRRCATNRTRCCTSRISTTTRRRASSRERLVRASGLCRAFFCNSGTEANEAALKFARLANPGRRRLVALERELPRPDARDRCRMTGHEAYRDAVRAARSRRDVRRAERRRRARSGGRRRDLRDLPRAGDGRGRHHPALARVPRRRAARRRPHRRAC